MASSLGPRPQRTKIIYLPKGETTISKARVIPVNLNRKIVPIARPKYKVPTGIGVLKNPEEIYILHNKHANSLR
jgi:hypothetical protein